MRKPTNGRLTLVAVCLALTGAGHVLAQAPTVPAAPVASEPSSRCKFAEDRVAETSSGSPLQGVAALAVLAPPVANGAEFTRPLVAGSGYPFGPIPSGADAKGPANLSKPSSENDTAACALAAPPPPAPFGGPWCSRPKLTGDWWGFRDQLRDNGYTFDISATTYYQGLTSGGLSNQFQLGGRNDYLLNVDGQKAGLWQGLSLNVHGETVYGDSINLLTGAIVPANIGRSLPAIDGTVTALTAFKFTQVVSNNLLLYAGKINTVDSLQQPFLPGRGLDAGFMNGAFLYSPVLGRTIPYSTFGGGAAVLADGYPVFTLSVFDTNDHSRTSVFDHAFDNGAIIYPTVSLPTQFFGLPGHQTVWGAYSSRRYAILSPESLTLLPAVLAGQGAPPPITLTRGSWWVDYRCDQAVWVDPTDPTRSWGLFGDFGLGDGKPNPVRCTAAVGIAGSSPIAGRPRDTFGLAFYYLNYSNDFKDAVRPIAAVRDERGAELFYNVAVTPWCHVTADVQVITPTLKPADTSVAVGLRVKIDF